MQYSPAQQTTPTGDDVALRLASGAERMSARDWVIVGLALFGCAFVLVWWAIEIVRVLFGGGGGWGR